MGFEQRNQKAYQDNSWLTSLNLFIMIAKILDSSASFHAVDYNHKKTSNGRGELMAVRNFPDYIGKNPSPKEVKKYLKFVSSVNSSIKKPQFHAAISCKGREFDKDQLTEIAEQWMKKMGYSKQPYIIVYHNDTDNNHVHVYSTRISSENGLKIKDNFEKLNAKKNINEVMSELGYGQNHIFFEEYNFQTKAQLKLLYEKAGYLHRETANGLTIYKDLNIQEVIPFSKIEGKIKAYTEDINRKKQLKAWLYKYGQLFSNEPRAIYRYEAGKRNPTIVSYQSDLSEFLKDRFGVEMIYHHSGNKPPYGYTLIDHSEKNVLKGSAIMSLKKMKEFKPESHDLWSRLQEVQKFNINSKAHQKLLSEQYKIPIGLIRMTSKKLDDGDIKFYKGYLKGFLKEHSLDQSGLLGLDIQKLDGKQYVVDTIQKNILEANQILPPTYLEELQQEYSSQKEEQAVGPLNAIGGMASIMESFGGDDQNDQPKRRKRNQY